MSRTAPPVSLPRGPIATRGAAAAGAVLLLSLAPGLAAPSPPAPPMAASDDARVQRLLRQMTLAEKLSLIHGATEPAASNQGQAGYWPGLARLGIPPMRLADGPPGVLTREPSTGMTATMGLAATFSRADAYANGVVIGRDARALGVQVVLEPFINLFRDQTFGRAYNTFGEDPFLTGEIAAAQIRGTQSQDVMAQAKHYVAYDGAMNVTLDAQALHEIYVAPFAAAVRAGVSSIMCSYNTVDGRYACGNPTTLTQILRDELHFSGFVTSDWGATHAASFINDGLDLEMPGALAAPHGLLRDYFGAVRGALRHGAVSEVTVTRAVGRILTQMDRFGYLQHPPSLAVTGEPVDADEQVVRRTAEDAAVLLENDGALPLSARALGSLALIGPGAGQTIAVGIAGEKALGHVARQIGTYQVLRSLLGPRAAGIRYAVADERTGVPVPGAQLSHDAAPGLAREDGRVDAMLDFTRANGRALPPGASHTWRGTLTVARGGRYDLDLQVLGAAGVLRIDGRQVGASTALFLHGTYLQPGEDDVLPTTDGLDNVRCALDLSAGAHRIEVQVRGDASGAPVQVRLAWTTPQQRRDTYAAAIAAARAAHTAVVFAWSQGHPSFALPGDQDRLIEDVAAANPNTVVVLNISQPIAMPWLARVRAVLLMWWPGDAGGWATADLLLGRADPAGRLPFTWPVRLADTVANDPRHPERSSRGIVGGAADGAGSGSSAGGDAGGSSGAPDTGPGGARGAGRTSYSEGILIGYRWFDAQHLAPLFPFGFGLSYTRFGYSHLRIARAADGGLDVSFTLRNRGAVAGDEVPQIYLGPPLPAPSGAQFARRALAGFERVHLAPAERLAVHIHVPLRQLQYWDTARALWRLPHAPRALYVGASSRDLRLAGRAPD